MYHFIAHYVDMGTDEPVINPITIDTYGIDEVSESTVWKWAIDNAFEYASKFDCLLFSTLELVFIS